jgi:hypothetical protein
MVLMYCVGFFSSVFSQAYFQQEVNFKIDVTLNDKRHELSAFEKVEYINNSPDTLQYLYFHLWPNAYSNNKTQLTKQIFSQKGKQKLFNDNELMGYIDSLNFKVEDQLVRWEYLPNHTDICKIFLTNALLPGDKIFISTPFHIKIPKGVTSRLGHINQSYQISQWFPKPAVYDKNGWHPMSYLDQGEFYSEFGSYDVSITLPDNYIVGATGELQNTEELEMLDSLANDTLWKSISRLGKTKHIATSKRTKTLHYIGNKIHDFAWFADKQFNVMKGKVVLPKSGKVITTWVMCTNRQSRLWKKSLDYTNEAILSFSKLIGDYPYSTFTVVQSALSAGLGMEYPGLTVIGTTKNAYTLDEVITHEIGHSWFYGALGSNERTYPFLDESITSNYQEQIICSKYPDKKLWEIILKNEKQAKFLQAEKIPAKRLQEISWFITARNNNEQPIDLAATDYSSMNYNLMIYNKASMCFTYLKAYLGDSVYDETMHHYYNKWKFRHPQPQDLRQAFESHTDKNLNWFFDDLIGTTKRLDYKIVRLENNKLLVKNIGELNSPLVIGGIIGDSICFEKWQDGFSGEKWIDIPQGKYSEVKIDPKHVTPELFRLNNNIHTSGIFPTHDPIVPQFIMGIEDPEKKSIMYIPAINWNHENGFMVGFALFNGLSIPKPIEYLFIPFYSFANKNMCGYGRISHNITPYNNFIRLATISLEGTRFGSLGNQNYHKLSTGIDIHFRPTVATSPIRQKMYGRFILASDLNQILNAIPAKTNPYIQFGYNFQNISLVNPYNLLVSFESGKSYQKSAVDFNYKLSYNGKNTGLDVRFFAGTMFSNTVSNNFYALAPSGRNGNEQYLYEGIYPDRFAVFPTSFFSRQMNLSEGGLVSPVNNQLGYSKWLVSLSMSSNLPGKAGQLGIKPFINLLLNDHGLTSTNKSPIFGETGIKIGYKHLFEIYIPILVTSNIQSVTGSIQNRIRFVMNLDFSTQGRFGL